MARFTRRPARTALAVAAVAASAIALAGCAGAGGQPGSESAASGERTVTVATSAQPKPYTYQDEAGELTGYDIEILKEIDARRDDLAFSYEVADFPALFAGLDSGRYDLVANNLSATAERQEKYDFTTPYIQAQFGIILPEASSVQRVTSLEDLAGQRVYGQPGLNFTKVLEAYNAANPDKAVQIEYTELDLQGQYANLAAGQVDFAFAEQVTFHGYAEQAGLPLKFLPLDGQYLVDSFGTNLRSAFAVSRQTKVDGLVDDLDETLAELAADGTLARLSEQFFGDDLSYSEAAGSSTADTAHTPTATAAATATTTATP